MNNLDPHNFIFDLPLYNHTEITIDLEDDFYHLMRYNGTIDEYNPILKENTTYKIAYNPYSDIATHVKEFQYYLGLKRYKLDCTRTGLTIIVYTNFYRTQTDGKTRYFLEKIGQTPSIADLHISKIREYSSVLKKDKLKEFTKAIGLAANGVGIGSFVYLRRIFESLIEEAHIIAKEQSNWDEGIYNSSRMNERIKLLDHQLPEFLVDNKELYGILSKGIHELEENECLTYFETVKVGIELILDEKAEKVNRIKKMLKEEYKKLVSS